MIGMALQALWILVGVVVFVGVIYLVLYGIKKFVYPIPERLEQGIWFIVLILVLIAFLTMLAGGSIGGFHFPAMR
jgi:bacteriorhodopsin